MTYSLSQEAKADLREIYRYGFFEHGELQADGYFDDLFACFEHVAGQPYLSAAADEVSMGYRRRVFRVHSIYYRVEPEGITIMRILGRQNTDKAL